MGETSRWLLFFFLLVLHSDFAASKAHIVYWNKTNPLFTNGDYEISVRVGDSIKIVCPHLEQFEDDDGAYLIINKDTEFAHMNCMLERQQRLGICDRPFGEKAQSISTTLRKYRPNNLAIEFTPGETHYLLSTSGGDRNSLESTSNGLCRYHFMRLKIKVDELDQATVVDTTRTPVTSTPRSSSSHSVPLKGRNGNGRYQHEHRRHTKKEKEKEEEMESQLNAFSENDIKGLYIYNAVDQGHDSTQQISNWEPMKMNADEMTGDLRGAYVATQDYIISEHSSSSSFSLIILSILVLIFLR